MSIYNYCWKAQNMKRENGLIKLVIAALLIAIAIIIPMFFPKIIIGPASFTLASHVPVMIALFISPMVAVAVAIGSTVGFFFAGFPVVVVLRALSHVLFVTAGALILKYRPGILRSVFGTSLFGLLLALIHAVGEVAAVTLFYMQSGVSLGSVKGGFGFSVLLLVGVGTLVHSMVDYGIALFVWRPLLHIIRFPVNARVLPVRRPAQ